VETVLRAGLGFVDWLIGFVVVVGGFLGVVVGFETWLPVLFPFVVEGVVLGLGCCAQPPEGARATSNSKRKCFMVVEVKYGGKTKKDKPHQPTEA